MFSALSTVFQGRQNIGISKKFSYKLCAIVNFLVQHLYSAHLVAPLQSDPPRSTFAERSR